MAVSNTQTTVDHGRFDNTGTIYNHGDSKQHREDDGDDDDDDVVMMSSMLVADEIQMMLNVTDQCRH